MKTSHIVIVILGILGFCSILAFAPTENRTPEQLRIDTYYRCVSIQFSNGRDVDNCNKIK